MEVAGITRGQASEAIWRKSIKKKAHNNSSNSVTMLLRVFSFSVLIYKDGSLIFTCQLQLWNIKKENARTAGTVSVMLHLLLQ